jgi:RNA-directed DNA polymerase
MIPKPGSSQKRPLGIPTVRDRVVQGAMLNAMEPIFERIFTPHSYGFRPGRGCKDALRRVDGLLKAGHTHVVDADIKGYFDSIPHEALMARVGEQIADGRLLGLLRAYLECGVLEGLDTWTPEQGTPQGAIISPLLANIYLNPLDHLMASAGCEMVRYADDFVILCRDRQQAEQALETVRGWMEANGLTLHPDKTRIADAARKGAGFDFLGYHFECGKKWPRKKSEKKLRERLKSLTRRNNPHSLPCVIEQVNPVLRGWYGYFKHSVASTMDNIDSYVRGRLRSILRKRQHRRGRARGNDHLRWPNDHFHSLGLFSLAKARQLTIQSSGR